MQLNVYLKNMVSQIDSLNKTFHNKRGVFFDMDGVLYDSMGYHAEAWSSAFNHFGIDFPQEMVYHNEGRTASSTINLVFQEKEYRNATELEIDRIYSKKTEIIADYPDALPFKSAKLLMENLNSQGFAIWVVTGSSQDKFLDALLVDFEGLISRDRIVSGRDVTHGKPHPEPYLTALVKSGLRADDVVVIENAPLGIQSAKAAGIFTIAVNTGILDDRVLWDSGADIVINDLKELCFS